MNEIGSIPPGQDAQGRLKGAKPVAVLDIGSNSVRLVAYERHARALTPLYNEKSACALGRGVSATGKIANENFEQALTAVQRFALVARVMGIGQMYILATSAVRDATNGADFAEKVSEIMQTPVKILTGSEEAHFAALGVVAGIPEFKGVVGDLGGGSLELALVSEGHDSPGETHPLGVIRLQDDSDKSPLAAADIAKKHLRSSEIVRAGRGGTFCAIGGTWRALAKLHQRLNKYPLHMVQNYTCPAEDMLELCNVIVAAVEEKEPYTGSDSVSGSRRDLIAYGAAVLREVIRVGKFETIAFSALGVREGYLYGELPDAEKQVDPLFQGAEEMSLLRARSPAHAYDLMEFTGQFLNAAQIIETVEETRLRTAVCYLADIGWRGHPDYRGTQSVDLVAYGSLIGVDHPGRAFLAEALAFRYMGPKHKSISSELLDLAGSKLNTRARIIGAAMRAAYPMSAGMPGILPQTKFVVEEETLVLNLPNSLAFLEGEHLTNRLEQLASVADLKSAKIRSF